MNILGKLPPEEIQALSKIGRTVVVEPGRYIVREDEDDQSLGILLHGTARVVRVGPDGSRFVLAFIEQGECFGELALILGARRSASVEAATRCEVLVVSAYAFKKHCETHRGVEQALLKLLAQRLHHMASRAAGIALLDTTSRVLAQLKELGEKVNTPVGYWRRYELTNQVEFAEIVGTSREMVSRALKLLEKNGEIRREGKLILIPEDPI